MRSLRNVRRLVEHNYGLLFDEVDRGERSSRALVLLAFVACPLLAGVLCWTLDWSARSFANEFVLAVAVLTGFAILSTVILYSHPDRRTGRLEEGEATRLHTALAYLVLVGVGYLAASFFGTTFMDSRSLYRSSALFRAAVDLELVALVAYGLLVHYFLFALVVAGRLYRVTAGGAGRSATSEVDR